VGSSTLISKTTLMTNPNPNLVYFIIQKPCWWLLGEMVVCIFDWEEDKRGTRNPLEDGK